MKLSDVSKEDLLEAVGKSDSIAQVLTNLGSPVNNGRYSSVRALAARHGVDLPVYDPSSAGDKLRKVNFIPDEEFFVAWVHRSNQNIKSRLIKLGWDYTCSNTECLLHGKQEWNNIPIVFQVDHINGDRLDSSLNNLRFLCPNCHSQTETYGRINDHRYNYCTCGRRTNESVTDYCVHLYRVTKEKRSHPSCVDCGVEVWKSSIRCKLCEGKKRVQTGEGLKIEWPPVEEILRNLESKPFTTYASELGVSDNAIRRHLRRNNVEPPKRYKLKS